MRKIALILCAVLLLGMFGCSGGGDTPTTTAPQQTTTGNTEAEITTFSAGFARENVTPSYNVGMAGYGNDAERISQGVLDDIFVTCVALSDAEGNTVLFYTADFISVDRSFTSTVQSAVSKETGVPKENIFLSATHNHSAPACSTGNMSGTVREAAVRTAVEALKDRKPAQVQIASVETEKLNFVRHYLTDKGTYMGDNYGGGTPIAHESEADRELQLIKFEREDAKDIAMINFQAHVNIAGKFNMISSDYIGACRTEFEKKNSDCHFAYFQGAAGNLNPTSYLGEENFTSSNDYMAHGKELARFASLAMRKHAESIETGTIKVTTQIYTAKVRKDTAEFAAAATRFKEVWDETGDRSKAIQASGGLVNSIYAVSGMATRSRMGESKDFEVNAISIGDISFVIVPYEMFDTQGMFIKDNTPFKMTFIVGYCNGMNYYIPSELSFDHGCYEVDNGWFVRGTAEELANLYVKMLNDLHG